MNAKYQSINPMRCKKLYFSYPMNIALITTKLKNKINVMPASWQTLLSYSPPVFGALISPQRYTFELLKKSNNFTANFIESKYAGLVTKLGSVSGSQEDKAKKYKLEFIKSATVKAPILKIAYASFECKITKMIKCGDHVLIMGRILNIRFRKNAFDETGILKTRRIKPLLYLGNNQYATAKSTSQKVD